MPHTPTIPPDLVQRNVDQRVVLHGVSWSDFETLLAIRGDAAGVRMAYLEGTLELMTPSRDHEILKKTLARLLEAYAEELGIELEGYGSWTLKRQETKRGVEPDECYSIGRAGRVPDLAIEVVWTSGGLDKLEIYRRLGVREVWRWDEGVIAMFALRGDRYEHISRSELLPQVDIDLVHSLLELPSQTAAIRELRARLRDRGPQH
jgi:Uma2 family endonuclease